MNRLSFPAPIANPAWPAVALALCLSAGAGWAADGALQVHWYEGQMEGLGVRFPAPTHTSTLIGTMHADTPPSGAEPLTLHAPAVLLVHDNEVRLTTLAPAPAATPEWEWLDNQGRDWFRIRHAHVHARQDPPEFHVAQADVMLSAAAAARIGVPIHNGLLAGLVDWRITVDSPGTAPTPQGGGEPCTPDFGPPVDLRLTELSAISQLAREPGGRVALAPAAWLQNVGIHDIQWYWAIAPTWINGTNIGTHPFLIMNFYRIADGRLEQIGRSDVKHAWNTVNYNCLCPGGQVMFVGCSDLYGVGNNGEGRFFGPRDEVTAHTGAWTALGSHFDGSPTDAFRNHGVQPDQDHDPFDHRLVVRDDDLATSNATYHVEAWYLAAGDTNIFNSIAHRKVIGTLASEAWAFQFDGNTRPGPTIHAWVNPNQPGTDRLSRHIHTPEGNLQLAVQVSTNSPIAYHYEYALMNFDYDRQVTSLRIPIDPDAAISGIGFSDADHNPDNQWAATIHNGAITWTAPPRHALDWGTLYAFRFDANTPPSTNAALLEPFEPGNDAFLHAQTLAPTTTTNAPPVIIRFDAHNGPPTTHAASSPGTAYFLESTPTLTNPTHWSYTAGPITANSPTISLSDTNPPTNSSRLYRLRLSPPSP